MPPVNAKCKTKKEITSNNLQGHTIVVCRKNSGGGGGRTFRVQSLGASSRPKWITTYCCFLGGAGNNLTDRKLQPAYDSPLQR